MKVTETADRMVFSVSSETNPQKQYRVDLTSMNGFSQCSCADWAMRRCGNIPKGFPRGSAQVACKHIRAARDHFLNGLLAAMAKSEERR
jgi:hypothetical protein